LAPTWQQRRRDYLAANRLPPDTAPLVPAAVIRMPRQVCQIIQFVATRHAITVVDMRRHGNYAVLVAARREAAFRLRQMGFSFTLIGRWLGGFHHTTIMKLLAHCRPGELVPESVAEELARTVDPQACDEWI
jgi:hypothetical protein